MSQKTKLYLTGKIYWAKIFGKPRYNKFKDENEWSFEFEPDKEGLARLRNLGLGERIKTKYEDRGPFITLKKPEFTKSGEENKPIRVYDSDNNSWDDKTLIGNESIVDVKIDVVEYGAGKRAGMYPAAIRVKNLVTYEATEFPDDLERSNESAPRIKKKDTFKEDFGLDDEIPV